MTKLALCCRCGNATWWSVKLRTRPDTACCQDKKPEYITMQPGPEGASQDEPGMLTTTAGAMAMGAVACGHGRVGAGLTLTLDMAVGGKGCQAEEECQGPIVSPQQLTR